MHLDCESETRRFIAELVACQTDGGVPTGTNCVVSGEHSFPWILSMFSVYGAIHEPSCIPILLVEKVGDFLFPKVIGGYGDWRCHSVSFAKNSNRKATYYR
jgi:hypothetical protein